MTSVWIHHDAVFLFVSNHKFKKPSSCPPSWNKRHQYAHVAWWEIFCFSSPGVHPNPELPSGVLQISSDGDDRGILGGLKFSIPGFYCVGKNDKYFLGWLDLKQKQGSPDYNILTVCQSENGQIERELIRNSSGFRFNVSFVDWTSVLVLEASLNFTYIL